MGFSSYQKCFVLCLFLLVPFSAHAHATPVAYMPESSAVLTQIAREVRITFSERLDAKASSIVITGPTGTVSVNAARLDTQDPRTLIAPLSDEGNGVYRVTWSVVSSDDGHFTKGTYAFVVGEGLVPPPESATSEIVQITTLPEIIGMTVELLGNGLIWAALLLYMLVVRPLFREGKHSDAKRTVHKGYVLAMCIGVCLALVGAVFQIGFKGGDLAELHAVPLLSGVMLYLSTTSGTATLWRMGAVCVVALIVFIAHTRIMRSTRVTVYEGLMVATMLIFAFSRAKISHATANPFFPEFSVFVNILHLIEKDVWAGTLCIAMVAVLIPRLRTWCEDVWPKVNVFLSMNLIAISLTASYIIWLHLKSFSNVFTTQWGGALLDLLFAAGCLVLMRVYHVLAPRFSPTFFSKWFRGTLAAEAACALVVLYVSSTIIITSPPLPFPTSPTFSASDNGVVVELAEYPFEDGMLLLTTTPATVPVVSIQEDTDRTVETVVTLSKRFEGGYVFPKALLSKETPQRLSVIAPHNGGYDARVTFSIPPLAFEKKAQSAPRTFDAFTLTMLVLALAAGVGAYVLYRNARNIHKHTCASQSSYSVVFVIGTCIAVLVCVGYALHTLQTSALRNPFKYACEADGNMWHLMLPMKAGTPLSLVPREGCMWGMGTYAYMFPDQRVYEYYASFPHAVATLSPEKGIQAGVPTTLSFSIQEPDGSPATLFVDMEKLLHIVIISEDQTVFAHIHTDDALSSGSYARDTATFSRTYTFPKAGRYSISLGYAHGITPETAQFIVDVSGAPTQQTSEATYPSPAVFGGYTVSLESGIPVAGEVTTLRYKIEKEGKPVTDILPYLGAVMHISAIKNDLSEYIHTHGEVHIPGTPYPPIIVKDGRVVHSMKNMVVQDRYASPVEAHLIFPTKGRYTVWGEFKVGDTVIPTAFTVQVE